MSHSAAPRPTFVSTKDFVAGVTATGDWRGYPSLLFERTQDPSLSALQTSFYAEKFNIDRRLDVAHVETGHVFYRDRVTGQAPVFFATGFVTLACVPPITHSTHLNPNAPHKWNQTVKITGLFNDGFLAYKQGYDNLVQRLVDECADGRYTPPAPYGEQYPVIQASTPIVSESVHGVESQPIPKDVDPYNILKGVCDGGAFSFMEENEVLYQCIVDQDTLGCFQIEGSNPARIRRGSMVEIGMSFIGVPVNDKRGIGRRIECRLEQVLLVSDEAAAHFTRSARRPVSSGPLPLLSRKRELVDLTGSYKRLKAARDSEVPDVSMSFGPRQTSLVTAADAGATVVREGAQDKPVEGIDNDVIRNPESITDQFDTMHVA